MAELTDILLNSDGGLRIENGDLVLGRGESQTAALLLETAPGDWRDEPTAGAEAERALSGPRDSVALESRLRRQLDREGITMDGVTLNGEVIEMTFR
jgi:hypothetical protein